MRKLLAGMTGWIAATVGSRAFAMPARRGPVTGLILCGTLLAVAILAGTAVMIGQFRERALANGERELENNILLLTRHYDKQNEDSGAVAINVIKQLSIPQLTSAEDFSTKISTHDVN